MGNNNKMNENDVQMVWVQKQVIMCWFVTFGSFRAKWPKLLTVIFLSRIAGNNNKMTENYMEKIWVKNVVILGWLPFLAGFHVEDIVLWLRAFSNRIDGKQQ